MVYKRVEKSHSLSLAEYGFAICLNTGIGPIRYSFTRTRKKKKEHPIECNVNLERVVVLTNS